jgi:hypothetical protein
MNKHFIIAHREAVNTGPWTHELVTLRECYKREDELRAAGRYVSVISASKANRARVAS